MIAGSPAIWPFAHRVVGYQWVCPECWSAGEMHYGRGAKANTMADAEDHNCAPTCDGCGDQFLRAPTAERLWVHQCRFDHQETDT